MRGISELRRFLEALYRYVSSRYVWRRYPGINKTIGFNFCQRCGFQKDCRFMFDFHGNSGGSINAFLVLLRWFRATAKVIPEPDNRMPEC